MRRRAKTGGAFSCDRRQFLVGAGAMAAGATLQWLAPGPASAGAGKLVPAPGLPAPQFLRANLIRMAIYEEGEGTPVVLCHGFPELAYSWRHQIGPLAKAGYRVIAPDMRGYGLTDQPQAVEAYTIKELCGDMAGLLDVLEIDRAVFCGHDWGGGVAWMMPRLHPERVAGVVGINTPAADPRLSADRPEAESLIVRTKNYYSTTFQEPGVADAKLARDVRRTFEMLMRRGGIWNVEAFRQLPESSPERQMDLLTMLDAETFPGELILSEEELAYYVQTFEATGFTGGLNWYRAARIGGLGRDEVKWDIEVPSLYVGAENDVILPPQMANGMESFISDFEKEVISGCGHWTQQEKPKELNRILLDWLGRKFGAHAG